MRSLVLETWEVQWQKIWLKQEKKSELLIFQKNNRTSKEKNLDIVENLDELITNEVTTVITMLPEGKNSKEVYLGDNGIINKVSKNCLLIDCSTIDIKTSIEIGKKASEKGIKMIDAPVSGGVMGAQKATLNIMVGGTKESFDLALPLLKIMGKIYFMQVILEVAMEQKFVIICL